ncbi:MAG: hypothetical protein QOC66_2421 [Pseudonocardiales bacterium]|jgi:GAF domain-containing protein|nr:hypothetical protein [Pseudonocardiales bacterium]
MSEPNDAAAGVLVELADLARAVGVLVTPPEADQLCSSVVDAARRVFGAAACSLAVLDDTDQLVYRFASGAGAEAIIGTRMPITRGLAGWVAQSGQAIMVSDLGNDQRFARDIAEATAYIPTALMAVPVESAEEELVGVLTVLDRDAARTGADRDLELASVFAAQAAAALTVRAAFSDVDRLLLSTLQRAATDGSALSRALQEVPAGGGQTPELNTITALLTDLYRAGSDERRLAVRLLREMLDFVRAGRRP